MSEATSDILFERRGSAGMVVLNRPRALNALTHEMVQRLDAQLAAWAGEPDIHRIVVVAAGERAFCAGGDIRALYDLGRAGRFDEALEFWRDEYRMNARLKRYPKPVVALIDGIVMGGGVGVSMHGSHRIAGDRFSFAMPEVGIGFFPDVGATYLLPRLPGRVGRYLALTGARVRARDALALGLVTHRVPSGRLAALSDALTANGDLDDILAPFAAGDDSAAGLDRAAIDATFSDDDVGATVSVLEPGAARGPHAAFCAETLATLRQKSPTSLAIAAGQMARGGSLTFEACMQLEFRIVSRLVRGEDFYEGVRALIVDKDQQPQWRPARLEAVDPAAIAHYFSPLDTGDLSLG